MTEFDLFIAPGGEGSTYTTLAVSSEGVVREPASIPLHDPEFAEMRIRVAGKEKNLEIRERFGKRLYDAIFHGDILGAWAKAAKNNGWLRLRLNVDTPELSLLPWELMHDGHNFLATDTSLAMSRYVAVPEPRGISIVDKPRVLLATASPLLLPALPTAEVDELVAVLKKAATVTVVRNCTIDGLRTAIAGTEFEVLHYLGHGAAGNLLLELPGSGNPDPLSDRALGQMLFGRAVRLVVLSACSSAQTEDGVFAGVGPALIRTRVPAVVAMQYEFVQLATAQAFNRTFYAELAKGTPVDIGVNRARNAISSDGDLLAQRDWSTPVLYLGTRSGRLITLASEQGAETEAAAASVRAAVEKDPLAKESWRQLQQTFETLSQSYALLGIAAVLRDLLVELRTEFSPIRQAASEPIVGENFSSISADWARIEDSVLTRFKTVVNTMVRGDLRSQLEPLMPLALGISQAIADRELVELAQKIQNMGRALNEAEAHLSRRVSAIIAELVSVSERTLGRLGAAG